LISTCDENENLFVRSKRFKGMHVDYIGHI
jgi:hypothetical protein